MKSVSLLVSLIFSLSARAVDNGVIRVGASPAVTTAGIYLAQEKGFFTEEKLKVEIVVFNNSAAPMTLLLSKGEIEVGAGNLTAGLFTAINKGNKLKIVADKGHVAGDRKYIALLVRKTLVDEGKVKSLKDLKGLKVALTSLDGSSQQIVLDKMLTSVGLSFKDVELMKLSYPEAIAALKTKAIDATVTLEPYLAQSTIDGTAVIFASAQDFLPNQQSGALFYSESFMTKRTEEAVKFMKAYLRGVRLYNAALKDEKLWKEVSGLLNKYNKLDNEKIWNSMIPSGLNDDGSVSALSIQADLEWYKAKNYIEKIPAIAEFLDSSFAEKAVKELAPPEAPKPAKKIKNAKSKR